MSYVSAAIDASDIIRRAAVSAGNDRAVMGKDESLRLRYYDALNDFMQGLARKYNWWFLRREGCFVTANRTSDYTLRTAASATITIDGDVADEDTVTISGRVYEFDTDGSYTDGRVQVDVSASLEYDDALTALRDAINGDDSRECMAARTGLTTLEVYWSGNSGYGEALSASGSNIAVDATFGYSMPDFSKLTCRPTWCEWFALRRIDPNQQVESSTLKTTGDPQGYAMTGEATLRIYSSDGGEPDGPYLVQISYQGMPSAVLPDGRGQIDYPDEFTDILVLGTAVAFKAGGWDEAAVFGNSILQTKIDEMLEFQPDETPLPEGERVTRQLFIRQRTTVVE